MSPPTPTTQAEQRRNKEFVWDSPVSRRTTVLLCVRQGRANTQHCGVEGGSSSQVACWSQSPRTSSWAGIKSSATHAVRRKSDRATCLTLPAGSPAGAVPVEVRKVGRVSTSPCPAQPSVGAEAARAARGRQPARAADGRDGARAARASAWAVVGAAALPILDGRCRVADALQRRAGQHGSPCASGYLGHVVSWARLCWRRHRRTLVGEQSRTCATTARVW
jgi:hypothetical protein